MIDLSVVIITRNQEWNVPRLINSVMKEISPKLSSEIYLIDSASTDKTIEFASRYPINILSLHSDQFLSASAGRYIGFRNTSGKYILFLDGDMALCNGWLEQGIKLLEEKSDLGAVTGIRIDFPLDSLDEPKVTITSNIIDFPPPTQIRATGGAALFQRTALEKVGPFNPFMISDEEPELCFRIRHAGYKIMRLNIPMVYHYSEPWPNVGTLFRRWQRGMCVGIGQGIRYHLGKPHFWNYVLERGYGCPVIFGMFISLIIFFISLLMNSWIGFGLWIFSIGGYISVDIVRKRSFTLTYFSLLQRLFIADGTLRGFFMRPISPESYPTRIYVVKDKKRG